MKEYKVAFIFTDEYHTPVEGKSYQIGSKEPISATSKPIILYFWMDDYVREWDKGSPKLYEDQHGSVIESLKWDGKNLNLSVLDYATFSQEEYNFSVGSECITPDNIVQENDYTSPYLITPTKIIVTDKIMDIVKEPLGIALREKLEGVWKGADKFTKVAENENFSAEYNACSSCKDSVLGLAAESSCSECAEDSFNVEFNDWADQEMNSHGKDISFNDWSKDEGLKHGNTEITDWAQHEDESHDARYGAETEVFNASMYKCPDCSFTGYQDEFLEPLGDGYDAETFASHGEPCSQCENGKMFFTCGECGFIKETKHHSLYYQGAETFEANAKTGNKVYIITRRCEDYSSYRELDVAGFGSKTEARKKFNLLFKEAKEQDYADETIADAKDYMSWGEYWGVMSFNNGEMIYELREVIVGDKGDFYFDAETFEEEDHYYDLIWDIPPRHRGEDYDAYYKHIENKSMSFEDIKDYLIKNKNKITPKLDKSPSNESNECSQCSEVIATYCPQCHESYCKDCYEEYRHWFDIRLKGQSGYGDEKSEIILKDVCWDNFEYGIFNNSPLSKGE